MKEIAELMAGELEIDQDNQGLLIPSNGGATFLVAFLNSPFTGVCQKI